MKKIKNENEYKVKEARGLTEKDVNIIKQKEILFYSRSDDYGWLSNFERSPQRVDGVCYETNEHYYQSQKAIGLDIWKWIKEAPNPFLAMKAGRSLRNKEIRNDWHEIKDKIMLRGLRAKFDQNDILKQDLLDTGNATLHEDSETDMFWGIKGRDILGKLLMKVREELKKDVNNN